MARIHFRGKHGANTTHGSDIADEVLSRASQLPPTRNDQHETVTEENHLSQVVKLDKPDMSIFNQENKEDIRNARAQMPMAPITSAAFPARSRARKGSLHDHTETIPEPDKSGIADKNISYAPSLGNDQSSVSAEKKPKIAATNAPTSKVAKRQTERAAKHLKTTNKETQKLGEMLKIKGLVDDEQLLLALEEQSFTGEKLGDILVRMSFVKRTKMHAVLLEQNPEALLGSQEIETEIPAETLLETKTVIFGTIGNVIYIATLNNPDAVIAELTKYTDKELRLIEEASHRSINERLREIERKVRDVPMKADDDHAGHIFTSILRDAIARNASDIHLDPSERVTYVRFRVDGEIHNVDRVAPHIGTKLIALIKNRSNLDVSETRKPQDGAFTLESRDFRVATLPSGWGEKVTIRILDREKALMDVRELGLALIDEWIEISKQPNGLILVCGATGSGKTTTLYSSVLYIVDKLHQTVFTVEDPVEYRLPWITQVQINPRAELTFARFLKSILRHDPDVIIVGEIRDQETMENALTLADTGHLVYATLHTNDVPSTITRMKKLGADDMYLSFLLRGILVQRLARKYCHACQGTGCHECLNTGLKGRTLISEFCRLREPGDIKKLINGELKYHTFKDDARLKLQHNVTTKAELVRVLGDENALEG